MNKKKFTLNSSPSDPIRIHLTLNRYAILDGKFEISSYSDEFIEFCSNGTKTRFYGSDIVLKELESESAHIKGIFTKIEFS